MTSFYGDVQRQTFLVYKKALCFDKCSRNGGKIQLKNYEFAALFGAKGLFSVANCE